MDFSDSPTYLRWMAAVSSGMKFAEEELAMARDRWVFPVPGGP